MTIAELMAPELAAEAALTRMVLETVPDDRLNWRPMEGLQTVGWNATHLAEIAGWVPEVLSLSELDVAPADGPAYAPPAPTDMREVLRQFDANLARSLAAFRGVPDAVMDEPWTMKMGGHTIFTMK
ncbi:MAG: DinB family protein, partial [Gemmataceae bacterium]